MVAQSFDVDFDLCLIWIYIIIFKLRNSSALMLPFSALMKTTSNSLLRQKVFFVFKVAFYRWYSVFSIGIADLLCASSECRIRIILVEAYAIVCLSRRFAFA